MRQNYNSATEKTSHPEMSLFAAARTSHRFVMDYTFTHKVVRNLKIVTEAVADFRVEGYGFVDPTFPPYQIEERYRVTIDAVWFEGVNLINILNADCGVTMPAIYDAALNHFAKEYELLMTKKTA
jgi:hypothetical protein